MREGANRFDHMSCFNIAYVVTGGGAQPVRYGLRTAVITFIMKQGCEAQQQLLRWLEDDIHFKRDMISFEYLCAFR